LCGDGKVKERFFPDGYESNPAEICVGDGGNRVTVESKWLDGGSSYTYAAYTPRRAIRLALYIFAVALVIARRDVNRARHGAL
jgi:hypothetical protein